jgi:hypothetical protein
LRKSGKPFGSCAGTAAHVDKEGGLAGRLAEAQQGKTDEATNNWVFEDRPKFVLAF